MVAARSFDTEGRDIAGFGGDEGREVSGGYRRLRQARRGFRHLRRSSVASSSIAGGERVASQSVADDHGTGSFGGGSRLVSEARRWIGTNPTSRSSLWCARFMNFVLQRSGEPGTGSDLAKSFASYGHRVSGPQIGAIAVMSRRGGGHVGVVSGIDKSGNPIVISGNHGHRVAEAVYPRGRIFAYVTPNS